MKGYTAKVEKITILGRLNDINVQVEMSVEYGEGINGIKVVDDITRYWKAAGLEPPVPGRPGGPKDTGRVAGANGQHPDDEIPFVESGGERQNCFHCGKPLYIKQGTVKNKNSSNYGNVWRKWYCPKNRGGCGAYNFLPNREARFDD